MPFTRPTPQTLRDRAAAEFAAQLPGADARSRRSIEGVLARVVGQMAHDLHGHLAWLARQIHVVTCDDDMLLERHASLWGIGRRAASLATGPITVTGTAGAILPAGAELRRDDDARYRVAADITLDGTGTGTGAVTARAVGAAGNTGIGAGLALLSPVAGIQSVTVADDGQGDGFTGGADIETLDDLRLRILERIQSPPHGGNKADYHAWTVAVPNVTRAWVLPLWMGPGTVGVTFCTDDAAYGPAPAQADLDAVAAAIDQVRPVTAAVTVFGPALDEIPMTIGIKPDTVAVRSAATAAVADFFRRESAPGGILYLSRLRAELSAAQDEFRHQLVSPTDDIVADPGHLAVPGTITWTVYP